MRVVDVHGGAFFPFIVSVIYRGDSVAGYNFYVSTFHILVVYQNVLYYIWKIAHNLTYKPLLLNTLSLYNSQYIYIFMLGFFFLFLSKWYCTYLFFRSAFHVCRKMQRTFLWRYIYAIWCGALGIEKSFAVCKNDIYSQESVR